jgi:hypothetical protein
MLFTSSKSYPAAIDSKRGLFVPAGTQFECVAYRQYFRPAPEGPATCVYWHEDGRQTVVYVDYHRKVDRDRLELPPELAGKTFTIVERTPSVTVHGDGKLAPGGIEVSVAGDYGYVVLIRHQ